MIVVFNLHCFSKYRILCVMVLGIAPSRRSKLLTVADSQPYIGSEAIVSTKALLISSSIF